MTVTGFVEQWLGNGGPPDTVGGFHGIKFVGIWTPSTAIVLPSGQVLFGSLPNTPLYDVTLYDTDSYANGIGGVLIPSGLGGLYAVNITVVTEGNINFVSFDGTNGDSYSSMYAPINTQNAGGNVAAFQEGATIQLISGGGSVHYVDWSLTYLAAFPASYVGPLT